MNAQPHTFDTDTHAEADASAAEAARVGAILAVQDFTSHKVRLRTELERLRRIAGPLTAEGKSISVYLSALENVVIPHTLRHLATPLQAERARAIGRASSAHVGLVAGGHVNTLGD